MARTEGGLRVPSASFTEGMIAMQNGVAGFRRRIDELPVLMKELQADTPRRWDNLGELPKSGIYLLFDRGKPIYVGRSRNIKSRLQSHGRPKSTHYSASFAFLMAKMKAERRGVDLAGKTRKALEQDP
ncbi:MAG: GIY-YIG nuclease family protein, partial [Proteobacteria bacterium]|nr:GIY-YIG nuclease family protein [Pseudomonadota bacterium]